MDVRIKDPKLDRLETDPTYDGWLPPDDCNGLSEGNAGHPGGS